MVRLERHPVGRLAHGYRRVSGEQVHHHALVGRVEMLDQNESHAVAGGQALHKLAARLQATGRGAYSNNREVVGAVGRAAGRQRASVRSGSRGPCLWRTGMWHLHGFQSAGFQRELRSIR